MLAFGRLRFHITAMRNLLLFVRCLVLVAVRRLFRGPRLGWSFQFEFVNLLFHRYIDWMMGEFAQGRRPSMPASRVDPSVREAIDFEPTRLGSISAEWMRPRGTKPTRTVLYIHGGGFITCSIDTHRELMARIALVGNAQVIGIDYRLAPEHPFPAMQDDCLEAYRTLVSQGISPSSLVVAGDSAGGSLTLSLMHQLKQAEEALPAGLVTLSPNVDLMAFGQSWGAFAEVDYLGPMVKWAPQLLPRYMNGEKANHPLLSPARGDLSGFPPTLIHLGDNEILRDQILKFAELAKAAEVEVELKVVPNMTHVFHAFARILPEAREALLEVGAFIQRVAR
jgi:epsilon-lactone hydrolase